MAINARIALKHSTEVDWQKAINFIPLAGEIIIYDADANNPVRYKIGDGTTNVNALPFATGTAVLYTSQALTNEQKEQARTNIGAISVADIPEVPVTSVAGKTGAVTLTKSDVGLDNVTNESKATMFTSPVFTGTPTAPTAENTVDNTQIATTAFVHNVVDALSAADFGLEQAMKFLGTTTTDISDASNIDTIIIGSGTVKVEAGNVVLYNGYEYVWTGNAWEQLGQEGSFALKSITISAGNGLEGGGNLESNVAINVKAGTGITVDENGVSNAGVRAVTQDGTDGHKLTINTGGTNTTITIPDNDTTYDEATTSAAGLMSAADKTFVDGVQAQIDGKMNSVNPVGSGSFSFGRKADTAIGENSVAIGCDVEASSKWSHAEGRNTTASGDYGSHAEGVGTTASGDYSSHAEGFGTTASGDYGSHAEGSTTTASGAASHAEGSTTTASGAASHAEGQCTIANFRSQHVQGEYNVLDAGNPSARGTYAHIVGNGTDIGAWSNAHTLDWDGNAWFAGDVYVGSTSGTNKDEGSRVLTSVSIVRW